jgi:hypothetical protein
VTTITIRSNQSSATQDTRLQIARKVTRLRPRRGNFPGAREGRFAVRAITSVLDGGAAQDTI